MQLPARIGKYELLEYLGGGMSEVYRARDTLISREVVVKILTPAGAADASAKTRFLHEARLAGGMQHENIVAVYDYGEEQGRPYMVMEFLRGEDLRSLMKSNRLGSLSARLTLALGVTRALGFIHQQGIIHRDVKPENIHVDLNGRVKLMDFGIAKTANLSLTKTGMSMGTPYYMAPEQVLGRDITPSVDVYAFGVMLYEMMAGARPFESDKIESLFFQILNAPVDPGHLERAGIPQDVRDLILRCTAKKPEERFPSFAHVGAALEALIAGQSGDGTRRMPSAAQRVPQPPGAASVSGPSASQPAPAAGAPKAPWIAAAVLGVAALAAAAWWLWPKSPPGPDKPSEPAATISGRTGVMVLVPATGGQTAFYLDRTEVSNAVFSDFCRETGRPVPSGAADLPVTGITIADARAFSRWAGKRLPSAAEWEKAARGPKGFTYPWGNDPKPENANVADNPTLTRHELLPVGSAFAGSLSPYGILHMAGNAFEFVDTLTKPSSAAVERFRNLLVPPPSANEQWVQIRGGSFNTPLAAAVAYEYAPIPERFTAPDIGFRCAKDIR